MANIEWTADRLALRELLSQNHPDLDELYGQAVDSLAHKPTLPRLLVAGHCVRELCSALPRVLGDPVEPRTDVNRPARELFLAWPADDLGLATVGNADTDDTPRAVSADLFRAARAVAAAAAEGNRKSRELTAIVATGQVAGVDDAAMKRLHKAIEFFRKWTHGTDYSKPQRSLPSAHQVEGELRILEDALLTRLGNMADRARAVREIMADANRRTTEGAP